ncbi:cyclopropane-fatty-acyl-phospholipid synthase family protein [Alphaproteobacteria bacterium]|nr:cyclopropane-fatty-acyl-phospholipid synthase family protein [Alphaproteobacteria bacterium]
MLFSILKKIKFKGKIDIIDYKGSVHSFGGDVGSYSKVRFTNKMITRKIFRNPSLYIGEGYMNKEIVIEEGTIEDFINIITLSYEDFFINNPVFRIYETILAIFKPLQQINRVVQSKKNVAHHYDLNEDLYRLMLDKDMQYSCGYFHNENISLDQAQNDKKEHIIEKLQIKENMEVLDIGCGWGGMALQIAKDTGARVKGITLSENQFDTAQQRAQAEGLNEKVKFSLQDYRHEKNKYDRIVSVGMFEHVGVVNFPEFFYKTYDLLKDTGIFLLHTIGKRGKPTATSPWIRKYIFPGGYIPSLSEITKVTEKYNINITDVEVLRMHYAHTLSHWYKRTMDNKNEIIKMFDERFLRMWEFYLLISKYSFINMGNVVYQIQIAKNIHNLPLTRNYIYN